MEIGAAKELVARSMRENAQLVLTDPEAAAQRMFDDLEYLQALLNGECGQSQPTVVRGR